MTIRNLDRLLKPKSIALIGASKRPGSLGAVLAGNLFRAGFAGPVLPVHPKHEAIEGVLAYGSVAQLPITPDLAVIATPPDSVPGLVAELGARGTRAAVIITAGLREAGENQGATGQQAMLDGARPHLLRIAGPNCLGLMVPGIGLNASFSHIAPAPGKLAFVTQSGALVTAMLDWAAPRGIGFSKVVSLGDMSDVDFGDMLDYLAVDPETRAILLYVEAVTSARKFMSAARAAARAKPVIVIKGGRHAEAAQAAASHTGALAGSDAVYDAAFARAGMLRVESLEELFDAAETLSSGLKVPGDRLAILTNGGGLGVLATDALIDQGGRLAELAPETLLRLDRVLPATWSRGNPVDIIGDAPGARYGAALEVLLADPGSDAVLVLNCPTAVASSTEAAQAVVETLGERRHPVVTAWLGEAGVRLARARLADHGIPTYDSPERAVRALMHLVRYRRHQNLLMETPDLTPSDHRPDLATARAPIEAALAAGRDWLSQPEAKQVLAAYGIPVVETLFAPGRDQAVAAAAAIGGPVALKIQSPDILHKSDVGGVVLDLEGPEEVARAVDGMMARLGRAQPDARIDGFVVEAMCRRPGAHELILGLIEDGQFGPAVLFGQGGTAVEIVDDKALALPPLNMHLARALMAETRVHRLLQGYRDRPAAALDAIAATLVKLAQLAADLPEVVELDINPLLADPDGVIALDARLRVQPAERDGPARLAIRPYPKALEQTLALPNGWQVFLRPIRPEDEPALREAFKSLDPRDVRLRFFAPLNELTHRFAARLTQIDYDREMALVAFDPEQAGSDQISGVVRLAADPDNRRAEFALVVRSDRQGRGLGTALMKQILSYAAGRGIEEVWGEVLKENTGMRRVAEQLGFETRHQPDEPGVLLVTHRLSASP
jgi:acetyltransferase